MEAKFHENTLVEDVLSPIQYRVYPNTPYTEVVSLMVRRQLKSVPVVREDFEFLGIITARDAIKIVTLEIQKRKSNNPGAKDELTAGDIMTRSVMCVSEEQNLMEATDIMITKNVEEIPVIRGGQMIGMLDRETVLKLLFNPANK
tara:strand:- start:133 stop:567 length:435 start_codon:yes stop_codon:yes gene_type:complete